MTPPLYLSPKKSIHIRPDFSQRPVTILLPRDRRLAIIVLALVCIWGAIGTVGTFGIPAVLAAHTQGMQALLPFALAFVGTFTVLYFGWISLRLYVSNDTITIDNDEVCFTRIQLFSKTSWCEPLAAYSGVKGHALATKVNDRAVTYQVVEMVHREPAKTLPLLVDKGKTLPPHILNAIATSLGLRVLANK